MRQILEIFFLPFVIVLSCLLIVAQARADVPSYAVVKEKSFLKFSAIQNSAPVQGKFSDFTAEIKFDPEHLDESSIKVEVALASVSVASEEVQSNIKMPDWLSVDAFPKAVFNCKQFTRMPTSNNYYANGQLTLRGKTVPVVLNFQMEHFDEKNAVATGYVTVRRSDFGVGQGEWARDDVVKNEVRIEFRIAAEKK